MAVATQKQAVRKAPVLKKHQAAPTKSTMNLAFHESNFRPSRVFPVIAAVAVVLLVCTKFGVLDQMDKKAAAYAALGEKQSQMQQLTVHLAGYDKLAAQYGRYSYGWMTETEASLLDRMQVMTIIEEKIAPAATIADFAINNNALTVNISGVTLDQTSALVNELELSPLVYSVSVYTAKADDATLQAQVSMTILLQKEAE